MRACVRACVRVCLWGGGGGSCVYMRARACNVGVAVWFLQCGLKLLVVVVIVFSPPFEMSQCG